MPSKGPLGTEKRLNIVQDATAPVPADILAADIVKLANAAKALSGTRLKRDTLILLLHDMSGVGKRDIGYVLASLDGLENKFLKPKL